MSDEPKAPSEDTLPYGNIVQMVACPHCDEVMADPGVKDTRFWRAECGACGKLFITQFRKPMSLDIWP